MAQDTTNQDDTISELYKVDGTQYNFIKLLPNTSGKGLSISHLPSADWIDTPLGLYGDGQLMLSQ